MKSMRVTSSILAAGLLGIAFLSTAEARTLRVLPIAGESIDAKDVASVTRLFRDALESKATADNVSIVSTVPCGDRECALDAVREKKIDSTNEIVFSSFYKLGSKWIFSATIMGADGSNSFSQRLTALSIEDMEAVTLRMADALKLRKTTEEVASVDNISAKETQDEPDRRRSLYRSGVAVGYLFPTGHSFQYLQDNGDPQAYSQIIRLTWLSTWEFHNNLQLGTDIVWNAFNSSIGADASLRYLFGRGDFIPFAGGGLGLHYVHPDDNTNGKRNSGPALNAQAGMFLFRTYDVNVMLRGQYQVIFNSDVDQGIAADVGVTFGNRGGDKNSATGAGASGWDTWDYIGVGALAVFLIAILSH